MKYIFGCITLLFLWSCGKKKAIELPEISHSKITEIHDVSAAYLFYDETKKDSVELNRKNLISTTNWLINIDKRLTLKQVIPHIKFLQEKKANSSHKNEHAKNYFTCHDTSRNNLGFIDFTDVVYEICFKEERTDSITSNVKIKFKSLESITVAYSTGFCGSLSPFNWDEFSDKLGVFDFDTSKNPIGLMFDENLLFQDYITLKSKLSELNSENITISKTEFIY